MSANRVTDEMVAEIIDYDSTNITDLTPFINAAHEVVDGLLSGEGYSSDLLTEIERWLAAHFLAIRDPRPKTEKTDGAATTYYGRDGLNLDATPYGQQAKVLDMNGVLASAGKRKASFGVIEFDRGV